MKNVLWKVAGLCLGIITCLGAGFLWKKVLLTKKASEEPLDFPGLKATLPTQDPGILAPKVLAIWSTLEEGDREELRSLAQGCGWEAYFLTDLASPNGEQKLRAVEMLGLVGGEKSLWPLLGALASKDETLCFSAAFALRKLQAPGLVEALIDSFSSPERWPPARVAEVILARGEEGVIPLLDSLSTAPAVSRGYIIELLGELGDLRAAPCLVAALEDKEPGIRAGAAGALARLSSPFTEALFPLMKALRDEAWEVRARAALALGSLGMKEAAPSLAGLLEDPDWRVKENAKKALEQLSRSCQLSANGRQSSVL